jgi:hypothetical protein
MLPLKSARLLALLACGFLTSLLLDRPAEAANASPLWFLSSDQCDFPSQWNREASLGVGDFPISPEKFVTFAVGDFRTSAATFGTFVLYSYSVPIPTRLEISFAFVNSSAAQEKFLLTHGVDLVCFASGWPNSFSLPGELDCTFKRAHSSARDLLTTPEIGPFAFPAFVINFELFGLILPIELERQGAAHEFPQESLRQFGIHNLVMLGLASPTHLRVYPETKRGVPQSDSP